MLRSVGICIADSDSNSSDDDSDDCIDHEQSVVDPNEISSGNDVHVIVSEIVEDMINNFQVLDESNYMKKQNICEISDEAETLLDKDLCCDSLESCSRTRETPPEKIDSNKVTLSFHPDSGLKGQPLANPCLSNDLLMSWLREHNLNWFALVREICQYLKNYSDEVINQCLTD